LHARTPLIQAELPPFDQAQPGRVIYVAGEETKGQIITLRNGQVVQLPDDVYVEEYITSVFCIEGDYCQPTPFRILRKIGTEDRISLHEDGSLAVLTRNPAALARVTAQFAGVVEQLGTVPIMNRILEGRAVIHPYEITE
jgi:hypothetical protein